MAQTDGAASSDPGTAGGSTSSGPSDPTGSTSSTPDDDDSGSTGADDDEPPTVCAGTLVDAEVDPDDVPPYYGFTTEPPTMALAETVYGYAVRTRAGQCSPRRVQWSLDQGPMAAVLELPDGVQLGVGDTHETDDETAAAGGTLVWDLLDVAPGCHDLQLRWRAWLDCDGGPARWGPWISQSFGLSVRDNHWVSGDLHIHTQHSERGPEAGGALDYYERMTNEVTDDLGGDFSSRRYESLRGRLHWLVFSDHTDRTIEECGRHFPYWCGDDTSNPTGIDVVRELTEADPSTLLVVGAEISNFSGGHFGFLPLNPYPGHPVYAPGYTDDPTDYDRDVGFGPGVFRERWVDESATNAQELVHIHEMNGLSIVNHEQAVVPFIEYDWSSLNFDGLEVWNGGNRHDQEDDNAYNGSIPVNDIVEDKLTMTEIPERPIEHSWVGMLKTGRWPVALVGGSDIHDFNEVVCSSFPCDPTNAELASPTTTVWAPTFVWTNGVDGVVDGIAAGRAVVHDRSNFIDLRVRYGQTEYMVGDTVEDFVPGLAFEVRAFGRVSDYIDGDNRVLLILGTNADSDDPRVDVLYNSADHEHFVPRLQDTGDTGRIVPDSSFDRKREVAVSGSRFGEAGTYYVWAQFVPWHNPAYVFGMGRDMAETGAIRIRRY